MYYISSNKILKMIKHNFNLKRVEDYSTIYIIIYKKNIFVIKFICKSLKMFIIIKMIKLFAKDFTCRWSINCFLIVFVQLI